MSFVAGNTEHDKRSFQTATPTVAKSRDANLDEANCERPPLDRTALRSVAHAAMRPYRGVG